jgi:hypothetical protein
MTKPALYFPTRRSALLAALLGLITASSDAAPVTWNAPTNIAGDSDVSTNGTLVAAYNFGDSGGNVLPTTVNGVTFQAFSIDGLSSTYTVGNFTLKNIDTFENIAATPTTLSQSLSAPYTTLLTSAALLKADRVITLTMAGLVVGQMYEVQLWVNDSGQDPSFFSTSVYDGEANGESLYPGDNGIGAGPNQSNLPPTPGQYVIGTFTANATSQDIEMISGEVNGIVNGVQLRTFTTNQPPAVPDSGTTLALLGMALAGLTLVVRRAARLQPVPVKR